MQFRRRRLRKNLRYLHPIPYLERKKTEEWNAIYDEAMRKHMLRMMQNYGPPRIPAKYCKYFLAAAVIGAIIAGYFAAHH